MYFFQGWSNCGLMFAELCWYKVGKLTLGQCHIDGPVSMSSCQCWPNIGRTMLVYGWQHNIGPMSHCQPYTYVIFWQGWHNCGLTLEELRWYKMGKMTLGQRHSADHVPMSPCQHWANVGSTLVNGWQDNVGPTSFVSCFATCNQAPSPSFHRCWPNIGPTLAK